MEKSVAELEKAGRFAEAIAPAREILAIRRAAQGEDHWQAMAARIREQTYALAAGLAPEDRSALAAAFRQHEEAEGLNSAARYSEAEVLHRKALATFRRVLGEDHPYAARSASNLAGSLAMMGAGIEGELLVRKALAGFVRSFGDDHPNAAAGYHGLAIILDGQGKYGDAEVLLRRALAIWQRTRGEDHAHTAQGYNTLACCLIRQDRRAEAEPLLRTALAIWRRTLSEDHPYTAQAYENLALCQTDPAEAIPLVRTALAIRRRVLGDDDPRTAQGYSDLAASLNELGKYAEAEALLRTAMAIDRRVLGEEQADRVRNLAINLDAQGRYGEAEAVAEAAARGYELERLRVSSTGLDRVEVASRHSPLALSAALLARRGRDLDAWRRWESGLARGLLDDMAARRHRPLTAGERRRQDELAARLDRLDNQIGALAGARTPIADRLGRMEGLRKERLDIQGRMTELESELARKYEAASGAVYTLERIQARLHADAALVGWLDPKTLPNAADPRGSHWAWVVRRTGVPRWIKLSGSGPDGAWAPADDRRPGEVYRLLSTDAGPDGRGPLVGLAEQRLAPLEGTLAARDGLPAVRHLIVLPSPALAGIPIEALLEARPPGAPRYLVSYAPSGTLFAWLQERREDQVGPAQPRRLLALGDPVPPPSDGPVPEPPDHGLLVQQVARGSHAERAGIRPGDVLIRCAGAGLTTVDDLRARVHAEGPEAARIAVAVWRDGRTLDLTLEPGPPGVILDPRPATRAILARREGDVMIHRARGAAFDRLVGSRSEVQAIAGLFDRSDVYLGSDASEQVLHALRDSGELARFSVIHLATHGIIDDRSPMNSRLLLSQDQLPDPMAALSLDAPACDGILSAGEVMGTWKLKAELVTLSACRSGLGRPGGGEGHIGFAQAFFLAGSRSLIVSLWEVDDRATSLLMTRFYQNWLGKRPGLSRPLSKAESLDEAKAWLRGLGGAEVEREWKRIARGEVRTKAGPPPTGRPFSRPHDWAGFILIGDPD
jgi:tetratricopeptide (TPR) repeat protein